MMWRLETRIGVKKWNNLQLWRILTWFKADMCTVRLSRAALLKVLLIQGFPRMLTMVRATLEERKGRRYQFQVRKNILELWNQALWELRTIRLVASGLVLIFQWFILVFGFSFLSRMEHVLSFFFTCEAKFCTRSFNLPPTPQSFL